MELDIYQQIFDQIKRAGKILIALPETLSPDAVASGAAIFHFLRKLQKDADVASSGRVPDALRFLPDLQNLQTGISLGSSLVVALNTGAKKLAELSYQTNEDSVNIFLKSKTEPFVPEDISFSQERFPVDLMIILGCSGLPALGRLFEDNPDLFYETPKINIDNKAANELFGAVNLVDVTATSVAEILSLLFEKYEQQLIDEDMATQLLTGIIANTHSFQHPHTTPRSFLKAGDLVALGGRQQEIIKNIFKTKPLALLKLWGRALARMRTVEDRGVIYSALAASDLQKAGAGISDLYPALREMVDSISAYRLVAILAQPESSGVKMLVAAHLTVDSAVLFRQLGEEAVVLPALGNFKVFEITLPGLDVYEAERKLQDAAKSLPIIE